MNGQTQQITVEINGTVHKLDVPPAETLVETLRDRLGLHSVRTTCGIGVCGTCTVLLDGKPVSSCLMLTAMAAGRSLVTAEGLAATEDGVSVQEAFVEHQAFQCSFCIPAMTLSVRALLDEQPDADEEAVREHLSGNLCRCGTYPQILQAAGVLLDAVRQAAGTEEGCAG